MTASARAAIRVLRAGCVPDSDIQHLTVGAADLITVAQNSLGSLAKQVPPPPLFIMGEWGSGKTHSIRLLRTLALEAGFATMEAVLNARTCPLNYPQRILPVMARDVALGEDRGLRSVVGALLRDDLKAGVALAVAGEKSQADISQAASTLRWLANRGETALVGTSAAWRVLMGSDIAHSDYGYRRAKAMCRIHWTTAFVRAAGARGTVLLFDELETIDQLWNRRSRATAYEVLGGFLEAPDTWCVFGITERFLRIVREDVRSDLFWNASSRGRRFLTLWRDGEAELIAPPEVGEEEAAELAASVETMYRKAYADTDDCAAEVREALVDWSRNASRNPRRLVRAIVNTCDRARALSKTLDSAVSAAA
ncbi:ATP-binding protein [Sphingomonas sp. KRR8]|uniref:BREX system ATP-binding domain-containing protein n=1 Tax=Sphingomonas sp. KRR8 TaxID=2942996 RepID=UPI0020225206|nr:BREX system ATP-binding domain-containing protein [Sphingomonas sp. KRR8]URD59904.1 ATP-binding protein [Sphingomonas sp. KRR8]